MLKIGQNGLKKGVFGAFLGVFWCFLGLVARCPLYFLITREKNKKVFFLYSKLKSGWESGQIDQNWSFCKFLRIFVVGRDFCGFLIVLCVSEIFVVVNVWSYHGDGRSYHGDGRQLYFYASQKFAWKTWAFMREKV